MAKDNDFIPLYAHDTNILTKRFTITILDMDNYSDNKPDKYVPTAVPSDQQTSSEHIHY